MGDETMSPLGADCDCACGHQGGRDELIKLNTYIAVLEERVTLLTGERDALIEEFKAAVGVDHYLSEIIPRVGRRVQNTFIPWIKEKKS